MKACCGGIVSLLTMSVFAGLAVFGAHGDVRIVSDYETPGVNVEGEIP